MLGTMHLGHFPFVAETHELVKAAAMVAKLSSDMIGKLRKVACRERTKREAKAAKKL